jgi:hypothetical protein
MALQQRGARKDETESWRVGWTVENRGAESVEILSARLPHGQFKAALHKFAPPLILSGGMRAEFDSRVRCDEPPGLVTENAFVIFETLWRGAPWRVFVRVRVVIDDTGTPAATVQAITTQRAGFSRRPEAN